MGALTKGKLVLPTASPDDGDNVGAYVRSSDGTLITHTTNGAIEALDVNISNLDSLVEDAISVGGESGFMPLGIRQDAGGSPVSATGDYHPFVFNADGELKVAADLTSDIADDAVDSGNPLKMGSRGFDGSSALTALSASGDRADLLSDLYRRVFINDAPNIGLEDTAVTVGVLAVAIPAVALAGRTRMIVQNLGDKEIFLGKTGVTVANGMKLDKGATLTLEIGQAVGMFAISSAAGNDVRVLELA